MAAIYPLNLGLPGLGSLTLPVYAALYALALNLAVVFVLNLVLPAPRDDKPELLDTPPATS